MSLVIRGGTVLTADRSYRADVRVEGEKIVEIGENLKGDSTLDASECYVMPGGIDPHTHLEMPFMGTTTAENFESGTKAALVRRDDDGRRLLHPRPQPAADGGLRRLGPAVEERRRRLFLSHVHHLLERSGPCGHGQGRQGWRHDLQAFHGLQGLADGQRRRDVRLVLSRCAELGAHAARARRERRPRRGACSASISPRESPGRRATPFRVRRTSRARRRTAPSCSPTRRACRSTSCTPPAFRPMRRSAARGRSASASMASR